MDDKTYNGWPSYATWLVNIQIFDGMDQREMGWSKMDVSDLADALKDYVTELLEAEAPRGGLLLDYALSFLSDVDWREIAKHMIENYADENAA